MRLFYNPHRAPARLPVPMKSEVDVFGDEMIYRAPRQAVAAAPSERLL